MTDADDDEKWLAYFMPSIASFGAARDLHNGNVTLPATADAGSDAGDGAPVPSTRGAHRHARHHDNPHMHHEHGSSDAEDGLLREDHRVNIEDDMSQSSQDSDGAQGPQDMTAMLRHQLIGGSKKRTRDDDDEDDGEPAEEKSAGRKRARTSDDDIVKMLRSGQATVVPATRRTVADALRPHSPEESTSGDDENPRPITMREKFDRMQAHMMRQGAVYPPVSDDTSSDEDARAQAAVKHHAKAECFLCSWGDPYHDSIEAPLVTTLNKIFWMNYGRVENAALAQMMHLYFKRRIYDPARGMPLLTQEVALEHIEQMHTLDPRVTIGEMIRRYMRMFTVFENEVFFNNGAFNRHAVSAMNAAGRMILTLYSKDPAKMNFYDGKMDIDPKQMGAFSNILANFGKTRSDHERERHQQQQPHKPSNHSKPATTPAQQFYF